MINDKVPSYIPAVEERISLLIKEMFSEEDTDSPRLNQCFGGIQSIVWFLRNLPANEKLQMKINVSFDIVEGKTIGK